MVRLRTFVNQFNENLQIYNQHGVSKALEFALENYLSVFLGWWAAVKPAAHHPKKITGHNNGAAREVIASLAAGENLIECR
jgi:hypothetical protein